MNHYQKDLPEEPFDPDSEPPVEDEPSVEENELDFSNDKEQSFNQLYPELESYERPLIDTSDELEPEDLIKEDGARSPHDPSAEIPADEDLSIVEVNDIGAGFGLDEAEWAHVKPLDGKPVI